MTLLAENVWLVPLLAMVISAGAGWLLAPLALRLGWIDRPGARKVHDSPTPVTGGVAVLTGLVWGLVMTAWPFPGNTFVPMLLLAGTGLFLLGLWDDLRGLSVVLRLLTQVGACLAMIRYTGVRLDDFGRLFGPDVLELGPLAVPLTVFAAMGVINAFNMIDGLDGLSGSIFLIAALSLAVFTRVAGDAVMTSFLLVAGASVAGFLMLNARWSWNPRARLFLGNSGSLLLGFVLAWSCIRLGSGAERAFMPMTAVWLLAVPLLDTSTLIWMRWREGGSAFAADQRHLHHAFLRAGFSVGETWLGISALAIAFALVGGLFELSGAPDYVSFYAFMACAFGYYFYLRHSWAAQRFLGRHFIHHDFTVEEGYA